MARLKNGSAAAKLVDRLTSPDPELKIHVHSKDEFMAKDDGWEATVSLYARGDFDGNGIEELLLRRDGTLLEGTYRNHSLFILTRSSNHGPLRVVRKIE
jgi:hypothetical protein